MHLHASAKRGEGPTKVKGKFSNWHRTDNNQPSTKLKARLLERFTVNGDDGSIEKIKVEVKGLYFVYCQLRLLESSSFHIAMTRSGENDSILVSSQVVSKGESTFAGTLAELEKGDLLWVNLTSPARVTRKEHESFIGAFCVHTYRN